MWRRQLLQYGIFMRCLECRRLLLAAPRERTSSQRNHMAGCADCTRLAHRLMGLERGLDEAALVPVPDALAARVLLGPQSRRAARRATAAVAASIVAAVVIFAGALGAPMLAPSVHAVGPTHPAVVAIAEVAADESGAAMASAVDDKIDTEASLRRLGLALKEGEANAHYVGKCRVDGDRQCDHIVLSTPDGHANVMLVPEYPVHERVFVTDRHMVALVSPAGAGGYIVVADSAKTAKRMEKLFVRG
jgi:hypothetical protein